jgi:hypothetical protein
MWTVAPLIFSLVSFPPPPLPCVNRYSIQYTRIQYTHIQCVRGGEVYDEAIGAEGGLRQINTCRKAPLHANYFRWRHLAMLSLLLTSPWSWGINFALEREVPILNPEVPWPVVSDSDDMQLEIYLASATVTAFCSHHCPLNHFLNAQKWTIVVLRWELGTWAWGTRKIRKYWEWMRLGSGHQEQDFQVYRKGSILALSGIRGVTAAGIRAPGARFSGK